MSYRNYNENRDSFLEDEITSTVLGSRLALQQVGYWRRRGHVVTVIERNELDVIDLDLANPGTEIAFRQIGPKTFDLTVYQIGEGSDA